MIFLSQNSSYLLTQDFYQGVMAWNHMTERQKNGMHTTNRLTTAHSRPLTTQGASLGEDMKEFLRYGVSFIETQEDFTEALRCWMHGT
jgi:hypothetical protein